MKIIVLQRGFVTIGRVEHEGQELVVREAAVLRRWGTRGLGLGHLATSGPTNDTVADPCGTFRAHELTVVMAIDVEPAAERAWTTWLAEKARTRRA